MMTVRILHMGFNFLPSQQSQVGNPILCDNLKGYLHIYIIYIYIYIYILY
jgi:hypothetical protein